MIASLSRAIAAAPTALLSVDLFDTLLLRRTRPEFVRFEDCANAQHAALGPLSPGADALLAARLKRTRQAYAAARAVPGGGEVRFDLVLAQLCGDFALPLSWVETLRQVELDYELGQLDANQPLALALAQTGLPWVVTSDTPLRAQDLAFLLSRKLAGAQPGKIYSSAELGRTKRAGGLFDLLCHDQKIEPGLVLHLGDNDHADVAMARRHGLRALRLPRPLWWRCVHAGRAKVIRRRLRRQGLIP